MDASARIVENAINTEYSDLSSATIDITKKFILDTIGVIIAGSSASGVKEIITQLRDWGGKEESSILFYGEKLPAPHAALVNSLMAHARELDDIHNNAHIHANITTFPATLAMAEAKGHVSGKDFITAMALGTDLACRMGLATQKDTGWHWSSTCGYFASALAAGKILNLNQKQMHNALGIAYSMTSGNLQNLVDGAMMKRLQPGFAAKTGVISAFLARKGITGSSEIFEGKYGYFNLYERGAYNRDQLLKDLGKRFEGINTSIKLYPSCRSTHASIDAMLSITKRKDLNPSDVKEIEIVVPEHVFEIVGKPFEIKDNLQVAAQFSLQYTVAAALIRKNISLKDFEEQAIRDPEVMQLARNIKIKIDHDIKGRPMTPSEVTVKLKNGEMFVQKVDVLKGQPENPLNREELLVKLRALLSYSAIPIDEKKFDEIFQMGENIEQLDDMEALTKLLDLREK